MTSHPVWAVRIADLDADYLIDRTRCELSERGALTVPRAGIQQHLDAAIRLVVDPGWRAELEALAETGGGGRAAELAAAVLRREGPRPFDPARPLSLQLRADAQGILDALARERQSDAEARGQLGVPLAAPLLIRSGVPSRTGRPESSTVPTVVEIGDLGDPFACAGHSRVWQDLGARRERLGWQWLFCAAPGSESLSHRAGAVAERVLAVRPGAFWAVVDTLAREGLGAGTEQAMTVLAEAGTDPALGLPPPDGAPLGPGLRRDRAMAMVCGLPSVRPLFVVGRLPVAGLDAAERLADLTDLADLPDRPGTG